MFFFFSSRRRHTRWPGDWSSDVCSSDLKIEKRGFGMSVKGQYEFAKMEYEKWGINVEEALNELEKVQISINCWQGDDKIGRASCRERGSRSQAAGAQQNTETGGTPVHTP